MIHSTICVCYNCVRIIICTTPTVLEIQRGDGSGGSRPNGTRDVCSGIYPRYRLRRCGGGEVSFR